MMYPIGGSIGSIETFEQVDGKIPEDVYKSSAFGKFIRGYKISTQHGYEFIVVTSMGDANLPYLNLLSKMTRRLWPHGVIGQTADHDGVSRRGYGRNGDGIIDGSYQDYEVSSIWGTDFKFNRYAINPLRCMLQFVERLAFAHVSRARLYIRVLLVSCVGGPSVNSSIKVERD